MKTARLLSLTLLITFVSAVAALAADPIPAPPDVAAPPADAAKTPSGLASKVLTPGNGEAHPTKEDVVVVHYTGWTADGKVFDSSVQRGKPVSFPLGKLIPGWVEGVPLMVVGEKRRFWIPQELAYKGNPRGPQGMLVFDIELLDLWKQSAPADVAAPPKDAVVSKSGLASKVLRAGAGKNRPDKGSVVTVNYIGWTTDGAMFDNSFSTGKPAQFPLNQVIAGWTEGLQLMVEGERRRFWIPEKLAYQGREGAPKGMLVFDVELIMVQ